MVSSPVATLTAVGHEYKPFPSALCTPALQVVCLLLARISKFCVKPLPFRPLFAASPLLSLRNTIRFIKMRAFVLFGVLPFVQAARIVQSNDDGWAESNLRTFFDTLDAAGHELVLSAPAEQQSGTGSSPSRQSWS